MNNFSNLLRLMNNSVVSEESQEFFQGFQYQQYLDKKYLDKLIILQYIELIQTDYSIVY